MSNEVALACMARGLVLVRGRLGVGGVPGLGRVRVGMLGSGMLGIGMILRIRHWLALESLLRGRLLFSGCRPCGFVLRMSKGVALACVVTGSGGEVDGTSHLVVFGMGLVLVW
jgi:hypothetical protein